jgi:hypothetical protein
VRAGFPSSRKIETKYTPARGQELRDLLNTSIVQLGAVSGEVRKKTPARPMPAVPIDSLLYRGRSALMRALELREEIVSSADSPPREKLDELLDLVALAATE